MLYEVITMGHLGRGKQHRRGVGAGSHTCPATDAGRGVHGLVGIFFGDGNGVGLRGAAGRN